MNSWPWTACSSSSPPTPPTRAGTRLWCAAGELQWSLWASSATSTSSSPTCTWLLSARCRPPPAATWSAATTQRCFTSRRILTRSTRTDSQIASSLRALISRKTSWPVASRNCQTHRMIRTRARARAARLPSTSWKTQFCCRAELVYCPSWYLVPYLHAAKIALLRLCTLPLFKKQKVCTEWMRTFKWALIFKSVQDNLLNKCTQK